MILLADHNVEGQAHLLFGALRALGWVDVLDLRLATFAEVGLFADATDREVWHRAQDLGMLLLTDNRNQSGEDSLQQALLEDSTPTSLPVLTVARARRLATEKAYREACAERVAEIIMDIELYRGIPRLYIP